MVVKTIYKTNILYTMICISRKTKYKRKGRNNKYNQCVREKINNIISTDAARTLTSKRKHFVFDNTIDQEHINLSESLLIAIRNSVS